MPIASTDYFQLQQAPGPRIPISDRCQSGRQGRRQRIVERWRTRPQRLEALWNAQHEQVQPQTVESYRDFVLQASGPKLRRAIYQQLALF